MSPLDIFWIYFIAMSLQPLIRQKMLELERRSLIAQLEKKRGSRVVLMVHRQETMSLFGFPLFQIIDIEDAEEVIRAIQMTDPDVPLDLVLHTPGGLVLASMQIARAIHKHMGKVTVFVPHYAMSGGTLIALAADQIVMSPHAVLGPVDPQLGEYPAASILKVIERKPVAKIDDTTLILADQAEKALLQIRQGVTELLSDSLPKERADALAELLATGHWTHDHPITFEQARELGLPVSDQMPAEVRDLLRLYPQPVRRQPTVEYLPAPRRTERGPRSE